MKLRLHPNNTRVVLFLLCWALGTAALAQKRIGRQDQLTEEVIQEILVESNSRRPWNALKHMEDYQNKVDQNKLSDAVEIKWLLTQLRVYQENRFQYEQEQILAKIDFWARTTRNAGQLLEEANWDSYLEYYDGDRRAMLMNAMRSIQNELDLNPLQYHDPFTQQVHYTGDWTPWEEAPASVTAYTRQDIQVLGARHLMDLVELTPGFLTLGTQRGFPAAFRGQLGDRSSSITVFLDGHPITQQADLSHALESISLDFIEQVEFVAASPLDQPNRSGYGGAIHLTSRQDGIVYGSTQSAFTTLQVQGGSGPTASVSAQSRIPLADGSLYW
ncbi:MAG TPA: hypothetical protein DCR93_02295, partial [Cytophagales bacterium]|nr:hypothetical protein [Cytophagales bacterium]